MQRRSGGCGRSAHIHVRQDSVVQNGDVERGVGDGHGGLGVRHNHQAVSLSCVWQRKRVPCVRGVALVVVGWSESNKQPFREAQSELNFMPVVTRLPAKSQRHQVDRTWTGTATETHAATTAST